MTELMDGIPSQRAYQLRADLPIFAELERYSDDFLEMFSEELRSYSWVRNPFHHWSRQWEYPFAANALKKGVQGFRKSSVHTLDAGSGITFFPFYLLDRYPNMELTCCDLDESLAPIFAAVNARRYHWPRFEIQDLAKLSFPDNSFDLIYSISVIEHLENPILAIREFARSLRPQGTLVLTFDISLNNKTGLTFARARSLMASICELFTLQSSIDWGRELSLNLDTLVTTDFIRRLDPGMLPWKRTLVQELKHLVRSKVLKNDWRDLTFCCWVFRKPD